MVGSEFNPQPVAVGHYDGWTICSAILTNQGGCFIATISVKRKENVRKPKSDQISVSRCWKSSSPDLQIVKTTSTEPFQLKIGDIQHDLHVDLHYDFKDTLPIVRIIVGVVRRVELPSG